MSHHFTPVLLVFLIIGVTILVPFLYHRRQRYPPGPPTNPFTGNITKFPLQGGWATLTKLKDAYGDLVFFHGLGTRILVLNSMKTIADLLEKRGNIYSDRPNFTVVGELMDLGQSMPLLPYGEEWRVQRKLVHGSLGPSSVKQYHKIQEDLAGLLAKQLLDDPVGFFDHVRLTASRLILAITYGLDVESADNDYITHAEDTMLMISKATVPGAFLCDFFPWMKHLPSWLPFQRTAREGKQMIDELVTRPLEHVKQAMENSSAPRSLTQELLASDEQYPNKEHHIRWSMGSLYGAGGETTYATVLTCIMAMALHPDKLRLAQAEIDAVVGTDRLPTIGDRTHLPYVNAVIKETMRWHPALPLGIARSVTKDDIYNGYHIPRGTIVIPNVWAVAFEHCGVHSPSEFIPERFLVTTSEAVPADPAIWAFGFARRICPGKHLAENSLFIIIATILAAFNISEPSDRALDVQFTAGLVSYPLPFTCDITPRSSARASQVVWRASQVD
ncbi:cytochrome P450 [Polyporus arcularius HHB13444]|uniref:Cytochrome P450 n=1 Tax=Polyporus arcularius HHB13444 TaxID=1314778 RepID=A0A5C3NSC7_9APHY|nr:cytochrome P450 [Polyporus arcularius HHB13444]